LRDYTTAIKIWHGYAEALNNRANIETILGRYESALKDYGQAIAADPNDPDYRSNLDRLLKKLGRSQD
jgi:tetratricopeptide (TPR) repeat protein